MKMRKYGDTSTEQKMIEAIKKECQAQGVYQKEMVAYILATVKHETNFTFQPVKEAYWMDEEWRMKNFRYAPFYGRGLVQLTWEYNYKYYADLLKIDLVNNPDLALDSDVAIFILVHGFKNGVFTGHKISEFINAKSFEFQRARQCINGMDQHEKIANYAFEYLKIL